MRLMRTLQVEYSSFLLRKTRCKTSRYPATLLQSLLLLSAVFSDLFSERRKKSAACSVAPSFPLLFFFSLLVALCMQSVSQFVVFRQFESNNSCFFDCSNLRDVHSQQCTPKMSNVLLLSSKVFQVHLIGRRLWSRLRTHWKDYIAHLGWACIKNNFLTFNFRFLYQF